MELKIVPICLTGHEQLLPELCHRLGALLGGTAAIVQPRFDPTSAYDAARGQFASRALLVQLLLEPVAEGGRILGVCGVDLFLPVLTYVFGEAQLNGRVAVVSLHRLRNEFYGLPIDLPQLGQRLLKEATHELGHTFGLLHCAQLSCVMHSSTYVEEIDLKGVSYCRRCTQQWREQRSAR